MIQKRTENLLVQIRMAANTRATEAMISDQPMVRSLAFV
ncbi:hypothetical protein FD23_GL000740 [Lactobacillus delbrueckii subsp. delbrueckii DSM 20074 = JCM 1012]|nr:hypothetical protein FD23_GL000740 [Lactobacillus delbrueckii subsp. delbrueckii DSM 20074 = JCM 1012]